MKIKYTYILLGMLGMGLLACSSDDRSEDVSDNQSPEAFDLLEITDGSSDVDRRPTFTWQTSTDPDGDDITYEIYLDTKNASTLVQDNLTSPFYQSEERLDFAKEHFWRVVARDSKGGSTSSEIFSFTTRNLGIGQAITGNAGFGGILYHSSRYFKDHFWILGGGDQNHLNARPEVVWQSPDGILWTNVTNSTSFSPRSFPATVVFKDKLFVIGGFESQDKYLDDVWSSDDGINWNKEEGPSGLPPIYGHKVIEFNDRLWLIGGSINTTHEPNVRIWASDDGVNWSIADENFFGFGGYDHHNLLVYDNELWLIGGRNSNEQPTNEIWKSDNGIDWVEVIPQLQVSPPEFFEQFNHAVVLGDRIWLITEDANYASTNGIQWETYPATAQSANFPVFGDAVVHDKAIWLFTHKYGSNDNVGMVWLVE